MQSLLYKATLSCRLSVFFGKLGCLPVLVELTFFIFIFMFLFLVFILFKKKIFFIFFKFFYLF